jgi:prepilin-type processing-associated H-X9-DG protein/prepilin-type N-terminal cleavage/methylation domain-containing protein
MSYRLPHPKGSRYMPPRHTSRFSRAFTMVELLVVIAILVTLSALVIPGVQRARLAASNAECVTNLRNISLQAISYAGDHGGDLPPSRNSYSGSGYWAWWLFADPPWNCPYAKPTGTYLKRNPVLCPVMASKNLQYPLSSEGRGFNSSYAANLYIFLDGTKNPPQTLNGDTVSRVIRLAQPARTALYTELSAFGFADFSLTRTDKDKFEFLHGGKQNFAFADGHVEALGRSQIPTNKSDVFWSGVSQ